MAKRKVEEECCKGHHKGWHHKCGGGCGCGYLLGIIGAALYYMPQATGFWSGVVEFLKSIVWPVFVVEHLLKFIGA